MPDASCWAWAPPARATAARVTTTHRENIPISIHPNLDVLSQNTSQPSKHKISRATHKAKLLSGWNAEFMHCAKELRKIE
jgi:hypothetical protein